MIKQWKDAVSGPIRYIIAASSVLKLGVCYIKHPNLLRNMSQFLMPDGVHLNTLGNRLFFNNNQGGLEYFQSQRRRVYSQNLLQKALVCGVFFK